MREALGGTLRLTTGRRHRSRQMFGFLIAVLANTAALNSLQEGIWEAAPGDEIPDDLYAREVLVQFAANRNVMSAGGQQVVKQEDQTWLRVRLPVDRVESKLIEKLIGRRTIVSVMASGVCTTEA